MIVIADETLFSPISFPCVVDVAFVDADKTKIFAEGTAIF